MKIQPQNQFFEASYWDVISEGYANMAPFIMAPFAKKAIEYASPSEGNTAIDVACGSGTLSIPLAKKVQDVIALDFSQNMIHKLEAQKRVSKISNIQTIVSNGQNLPFEDNIFDIGFSMFGLMFFPDRIKGFRELYRVIKPKGKIVVSSWTSIKQSHLMMMFFYAMQAGFPEAPIPKDGTFPLDNPEILKEEIERGGFQNVHIHKTTCFVPPITPKKFWNMMADGGPMLIIKKEVGEKKWQTISAQAIDYLTETVGERGTEIATSAYLGIAEKI